MARSRSPTQRAPDTPTETNKTPRTRTQLPTADPPVILNPLAEGKSEPLLPDTLNCVTLNGLQPKYKELRDHYRDAKRKFSECTENADNKISKLKRTKMSGPEGAKDYENLVFEAIRVKYDAYLEGLETVRNSLSELQRQLVKDHGSGDLPLTQEGFNKQYKFLDERILAATKRIIIAQSSRHTVQGAMVDEAIYGAVPRKLSLDGEIDQEERFEWAYIDQLISRFADPKGATRTFSKRRDKDSQQRFRADVMRAYGALEGDPSRKNDSSLSEEAWCVISGKSMPRCQVAAAHIVGWSLGEPSANHIFGQADNKLRNGHLMSPNNGLPMLKDYEEMLDDGSIVLEPVGEDGTDWKVIVLNKDERECGLTETYIRGRNIKIPCGEGLHNRKLSFVNDFRPSRQYLYFTYCLNILRRQRLEVPGWWRDSGLLNGQAVWSTPDQYLRRSTMQCMARLIGRLDERDAAIMAKKFPALKDESDADTARLNNLITSRFLVEQDGKARKDKEDDHDSD